MAHKEFDLNKIVAQALSESIPFNISEYKLVASNVAKVIINTSVSAQNKSHTLLERIAASFQNHVVPVPDSFTWLVEGRSMIGYVASARPTRGVDDMSKYTVLASNMLMDETDQTLWELKEGSGGKYLARQETADVQQLLEASRVSPSGSTPRMSSVISASVNKNEFISYVHASGFSLPSVEYGFCVARDEQNGTVRVATTLSSKPITVPVDLIVASHAVNLQTIHSGVVNAKAVTAADMSTLSPEEYWKKAFQHSSEYVDMIIDQIRQHRAM